MAGRVFSPAMICWLRVFYPGRPLEETARMLCEASGRRVTKSQLQCANKRYRFGKASMPNVVNRKSRRMYSDEMLAWLKRNYPLHSRAETARLFKREFGRELTVNQLKAANRHYGFGTAALPPGGHPGARATQFKPGGRGGQKRGRDAPLYAERVNADGYIEIKVPVPHKSPCMVSRGWNQETSWMSKARWVWIQEEGEIPAGHAVIFVDGDRSNCDIGNLACVSRTVLRILNAPALLKLGGKEAYATRVRIAQLKGAISQRKAELRSA